MDSYRPELHTLLDVLTDFAQATPDADFLSALSNVSLSYRQTLRLSTQLLPARLAEACPALIQKPNAKVAIISPNTPLSALAFWAAWSASATVVPLSTSADPALWVSMMELTKPDLILVAQSLITRLPDTSGLRAPVLALESLVPGLLSTPKRTSRHIVEACQEWLLNSPDDIDQRPRPSPSTPAALMFTSSAIDAATLKCVTYTHSALLEASWKSIRGLGDGYAQNPKRHLGWLPLSHCYEMTFSFLGIVLRTGGAYIFHDPGVSSPDIPSETPLPQQLLLSLEFHQPVDSFCIVPAIFAGLYSNLSSTQLHCLRTLSSLCAGGAASPVEMAEWATREGIKYADMIGATELVGLLATQRFWEKPHGFDLAYGFMGVLEKEEEEDNFGELIVMGKHLPTSYDFNNSNVFQHDPSTGVTIYRTQDVYSYGSHFVGKTILVGQPLPSYDPTSRPMSDIRYIGRLDDIVTFNSGIKADAVALENSLNSQAEISRSAIIPTVEKDALVALIVPAPKCSHLEVTAAVMRVNSTLAYEKRIRRENVVLVDSLPLTTKLTLHRKKLKRIVADAGGKWPRERTLGAITLDTSIPPRKPRHVSRSAIPIPKDIRLRMEDIIADIFSISLDDVRDPGFRMSDLPITSLASVRLAKSIQEAFDAQPKQSELYSCSDISDLCLLVLPPETDIPSPISDTSTRISPSPPPPARDDDTIVISGVSCRYPGGISSLDSFWSTLLFPDQHTAKIARPAPPSRWDAKAEKAELPIAWLDNAVVNNASAVAAFFRLPPAEVEAMPPNIRLVMQMGYSALEDAGISPRSLRGKPWGVFTSMNDSGWRETRVKKLAMHDYARFMTSLADDSAGARLSYYLDLTGPATEVKSACSSSAVAIHQACAAIRNGDCEGAIVIAATTHFSPAGAIFREYAGIGSPSGRCATFSENADGFLPSEGAVAVVIQREIGITSPAYARIRASAVVQDGRGQNFASPNMNAQARLLEMALKRAGCEPDDISYIEAHGTGTPVGDAIEIGAINRVFGNKRSRPLFVGAAKAVYGHTEEGSGLTGVLKAIACFEHNMLPPQPHLQSINKELDLFSSKIVIPRGVQAFSERNRPRLVGVSSFGLSGTLAHLILEESTWPEPTFEPGQGGVFLASAISSRDMRASLQQILEYTSSVQCRQTRLVDACRTTQIGRDHFAYRKAWAVRSWQDLARCVRAALEDTQTPPPAPRNPGITLWFGLPHPARLPPVDVAVSHPIYKDTIHECRTSGCTPDLELFAQQLAVARTLEAAGCRIAAVGGEGAGEYVAACFAGVLSTSTLFAILTTLSHPAPEPATSWLVHCAHPVVEDHLLDFGPADARIVAHYGPDLCCVAGTPEALATLRTALAPAAFSPAHALSAYAAQPPRSPLAPQIEGTPRLPLVSARLGAAMDAAVAGSACYWEAVAQSPVFADAACAALGALGAVVDVSVTGGSTRVAGDADGGAGGVAAVLGRVFELGCTFDWSVVVEAGPTCHMPAYPWGGDIARA